MLYEPPQDLNDLEKEVLVLKTALRSIDSMVNYGIFMPEHKTVDTNLMVQTSEHHQLFSILLLDFLSLETFEERRPDLLDQLIKIGNVKRLGPNSDLLLFTCVEFQKWLNTEVDFELWGHVRKSWFSAIDVEIELKITRGEFIKICGNMSKHNHQGLSRQAKLIQKIFERSGHIITIAEAFLTMEDFYEQFHRDLYVYHLSTIAEFLNNIRWGIYYYTRKLYGESNKPYLDEKHNMNAYTYELPSGITNE